MLKSLLPHLRHGDTIIILVSLKLCSGKVALVQGFQSSNNRTSQILGNADICLELDWFGSEFPGCMELNQTEEGQNQESRDTRKLLEHYCNQTIDLDLGG